MPRASRTRSLTSSTRRQSEKTPDDPFYTADYGLVDQPDDHDVDAPEAWGPRTGCGKVAILDTGIDTDHPDLKGNLYKSKDKPNNNKDDDKNGYVDDTYGYNVIKGKGSGQDDEGHGTHVRRHRRRAREQLGGHLRHLLVGEPRRR